MVSRNKAWWKVFDVLAPHVSGGQQDVADATDAVFRALGRKVK